jgi:ATP-dependent Lon protease
MNPKLTDYEITISDKKSGRVYDVIDLESYKTDKIEEWKKYFPNDIFDDESLKSEIVELMESYLTDIIKENK